MVVEVEIVVIVAEGEQGIERECKELEGKRRGVGWFSQVRTYSSLNPPVGHPTDQPSPRHLVCKSLCQQEQPAWWGAVDGVLMRCSLAAWGFYHHHLHLAPWTIF